MNIHEQVDDVTDAQFYTYLSLKITSFSFFAQKNGKNLHPCIKILEDKHNFHLMLGG